MEATDTVPTLEPLDDQVDHVRGPAGAPVILEYGDYADRLELELDRFDCDRADAEVAAWIEGDIATLREALGR